MLITGSWEPENSWEESEIEDEETFQNENSKRRYLTCKVDFQSSEDIRRQKFSSCELVRRNFGMQVAPSIYCLDARGQAQVCKLRSYWHRKWSICLNMDFLRYLKNLAYFLMPFW